MQSVWEFVSNALETAGATNVARISEDEIAFEAPDGESYVLSLEYV